MDRYIFITIIVILAILLIHSHRKNSIDKNEKNRLINIRDASLKIAGKVVNAQNSADIYPYILETCLKLIPKAKFGSILLLNSDGLLAPKASIGFSPEISKLRLKPEELFLYLATKGKMDQTVIMNRIEELVKKEASLASGYPDIVIRSEVASPLHINGELVGVLCVDGDQNDIFVEQDIYTLEYMSIQISIVINHQKLYNELLSLTQYDRISQMLNRENFVREAEKLLSDPSKDAPNLHFVLIDLDDLKSANDKYGHQFGDEIVAGFSEILRRHLGRNDLCGRYGGDEFAAIIQGDTLYLNHMLEEARAELMELKGKFTSDFIPSFSYGNATFVEGSCNIESLYTLADSRMTQMKKNRKAAKI
ncbi:MAG: sensor domain-containing diguanylate cyclase [Eubacteriales bacterium]|nr:sensor domain-containing diguanylate cyclase [Eubacteriales bacterium]